MFDDDDDLWALHSLLIILIIISYLSLQANEYPLSPRNGNPVMGKCVNGKMEVSKYDSHQLQ